MRNYKVVEQILYTNCRNVNTLTNCIKTTSHVRTITTLVTGHDIPRTIPENNSTEDSHTQGTTIELMNLSNKHGSI